MKRDHLSPDAEECDLKLACYVTNGPCLRRLMTDDKWAIFEPFLKRWPVLGSRPTLDHRRTLDCITWIGRTGEPWRDLPAEFGNWNSVWRQFRHGARARYGMNGWKRWSTAVGAPMCCR